jgi:hypothetical protein
LNKAYLLKKIGTAPPAEKKVTEDQSAYDIISRMMVKHKACACDYDKIAEDFDEQTIYQVAKKLWGFCKKNIAYDEETIERQEVSSPQRILQRGHCDCKGYALFIGGVLDALNRKGWDIKWRYRFASDDPFNEVPGHVFVVITDKDNEIWVDPVLSEFNQDHYFPYYEDRKVSAPAAMAGCGCSTQKIGSTASTGKAIMSVAPALATVPVVGYIGAAAAEVVGFFLSAFGSKYNSSTGVRWLVQRYQYYVLGQNNVSNDRQVDEKYIQPTQGWFSTVLGVPIYDQYRYHALHGSDPNTGKLIPGITRDQRAKNYLASAPDAVAAGVTYDQALAATYEADKFVEPGPAGSWASFTAASALVETDPNAQPTSYVNQNGQLVTSAGQPVVAGNKNILLAAAAVIALILIVK